MGGLSFVGNPLFLADLNGHQKENQSLVSLPVWSRIGGLEASGFPIYPQGPSSNPHPVKECVPLCAPFSPVGLRANEKDHHTICWTPSQSRGSFKLESLPNGRVHFGVPLNHGTFQGWVWYGGHIPLFYSIHVFALQACIGGIYTHPLMNSNQESAFLSLAVWIGFEVRERFSIYPLQKPGLQIQIQKPPIQTTNSGNLKEAGSFQC